MVLKKFYLPLYEHNIIWLTLHLGWDYSKRKALLWIVKKQNLAPWKLEEEEEGENGEKKKRI